VAILWLKNIVNHMPGRVSVLPNDTKNPTFHRGEGIKLPTWQGAGSLNGSFTYAAGQTFWLEPGGYVAVDDFAIPWQPGWIKFGGDDPAKPYLYTNTNHVSTVSCAPAADGADHVHCTTPAGGLATFPLGQTGPFHQLVGDLVLGLNGQAHMKPHPGTQGDTQIWNGLSQFAHHLSVMIDKSTRSETVQGPMKKT